MTPLQVVLQGFILPAALTSMLLAFSIQMPELLRRITHLLAPGFGFLTSFYLLFGEPQNPIVQVSHWIVFLPFIFVIVLAIQEIKKQKFSKTHETIFSILPSILVTYLFLRNYQIEIPWVAVIGINMASISYFYFFFKKSYKDPKGTDSLWVSFISFAVLTGILYFTSNLAQAQLAGVFLSINAVFLIWNSLFRIQTYKHLHVSVSLTWLLLPWVLILLASALYSDTSSYYLLAQALATSIAMATLKFRN